MNVYCLIEKKLLQICLASAENGKEEKEEREWIGCE